MANLYTLSGTLATPWQDMSPFNDAIQFQGNVTGAVTIVLETSNDPTTAHADVTTADTYTTSFNKAASWPIPRFIRLRMTAGAGSAIVSFGPSKTQSGFSGSVSPIGTSNQPSNLFQ